MSVSIRFGMSVATGLPDKSAWALDPSLAYLNHGGFGATPVCVLAEQQAWRDAMELNPVGFLVNRLPELLAGVRAEVAAFLGADEAGLVFVGNATKGMQTVIAQAALGAGDEVLTTDHCYPAVLAQLRRAASATGAVLRIAPVPLPASDRQTVAEAVLSQPPHPATGRRSRGFVQRAGVPGSGDCRRVPSAGCAGPGRRRARDGHAAR